MTYSIVARDPGTGALGVAVQSHWFSVGSIVPWARPGVGAVATQATARVDYGPRGLELMAAGASAAEALAALASEDPGRDARQVAMVDARGGVAAVTGSACMAFAGDARDDGVSCQGNIMVSEAVWPAMLAAWRELDRGAPFPERLLGVLRAAQATGGDLRGVQSAALLVVPAAGEPWETTIDLRVEDAADPLGELARLLALQRAYAAASDGDDRLAAGDRAGAAERYAAAARAAPDVDELAFWGALGTGDEASLAALCAAEPRWGELLARLPPEGRPLG